MENLINSNPGQPKQCVIILGMHRSGTSSLAGAMSLLGFDLGKQLVPGDTSNPKGHFENLNVLRFNMEVLGSLGVKWADVYKVPFGELAGDHLITKHSSRLKSLLREEFTSGRPWLIKDPRICVLLPLWKKALDELGMEQTYIILTRHPADTVISLSARNNLSAERAEVNWTYYVLASEYFTRGKKRIFINHDELISNPLQEIKRIGSFLDFPVSVGANEENEVLSFIDPKLIRAKATRQPVDLGSGAKEVFHLVSQLRNGDQPSISGRLDEVKSGLITNRYFMPLPDDHSWAEIMIFYASGEIQRERFKVNVGENSFSVAPDPEKEVSFARLVPCNNDCVIQLTGAGITIGEETISFREKVFSNAIVHIDNTFLFTSLPQYFGFKIGGAGITSVHFTAEYDVIGDRASKQFILTHFRKGSILFHGDQPSAPARSKFDQDRGEVMHPAKPAKKLVEPFLKPFQFVQRIFKG